MRKLGLINCEGNIVEFFINLNSSLTFRVLLNSGVGYIEFKPRRRDLKQYLTNQCSLSDLVDRGRDLLIIPNKRISKASLHLQNVQEILSSVTLKRFISQFIHNGDLHLNDQKQNIIEENLNLLKNILLIKNR